MIMAYVALRIFVGLVLCVGLLGLAATLSYIHELEGDGDDRSWD